MERTPEHASADEKEAAVITLGQAMKKINTQLSPKDVAKTVRILGLPPSLALALGTTILGGGAVGVALARMGFMNRRNRRPRTDDFGDEQLLYDGEGGLECTDVDDHGCWNDRE